MHKPLLLKKLGSVFVIALLLSVFATNAAFADDGTPPHPSTPVVERQGGPVVHREAAVPIGNKSLLSATVYRAGWTDAWRVWTTTTTEHHGGHNSQSDLVEQNIWVDGSLKVNGVNVDSCSNHTSGQYSYCGTVYSIYFQYSITAKSWHYFHKSGYVDQNFTTSKSIS